MAMILKNNKGAECLKRMSKRPLGDEIKEIVGV